MTVTTKDSKSTKKYQKILYFQLSRFRAFHGELDSWYDVDFMNENEIYHL